MKRFVIPTPCTLVLADDGTLSIELAPAEPTQRTITEDEANMLARLRSLYDFEERSRIAATDVHPYPCPFHFADAGPLARWLRTGEWPT